jgi:hypothetical protein
MAGRRNPATGPLLDATDDDHLLISTAMNAVTDAAQACSRPQPDTATSPAA